MRKNFALLGAFLILALLTACAKENTPPPSAAEGALQESGPKPSATEEVPEKPQEETWRTAPEYDAPLISASSIRFLSVTVGSSEEEACLTWFSPSEKTGQAYWTTADDAEFENASVFSVSAVPSAASPGYYVNRVTITGLTQETEYLYRVGNEDGLSPAYAYTTPAFSDSFRFTVVGDAQLGRPTEDPEQPKNNWHKLLNKVKYHFPDASFLASLGDQVENYDSADQYSAFLNEGALYSLSLAPIKGNHDMGGPQYSEHFTLPNQSELGNCDDAGDGDYWFRRGDALFLALNTMNTEKWNEHAAFIASAAEANPDARWRIVLSHYSPYNAYENYRENAQSLRPYFLDFASAYKIDLVLSGHDHAYTRTYFIQKDGSFQEYESPATDPEGTMYLILNSSSGSLYHQPSPQDEAILFKMRKQPEVTDIQVTPDSLKISTYIAETWKLTDEFEIRKSSR